MRAAAVYGRVMGAIKRVVAADMENKWQSEKLWQEALRVERGHLRRLEAGPFNAGPKAVEDARRRVQRIFAAGLAEWQQGYDWRRLPLP